MTAAFRNCWTLSRTASASEASGDMFFCLCVFLLLNPNEVMRNIFGLAGSRTRGFIVMTR